MTNRELNNHPDAAFIGGLSALMGAVDVQAERGSCPDCGGDWAPEHRGFTKTEDGLEDLGWTVVRGHADTCHHGQPATGPCRCAERLAALEAGEAVWGTVGCRATFCPIGVPNGC